MCGMSSSEKVLSEALALPSRERARLARELLQSLDGTEDEGATDAWGEELERRLDDLEGGGVQGLSLEEVKKRMSERRAARRSQVR
jgi:putative addiction module component (TIGR02574 family)